MRMSTAFASTCGKSARRGRTTIQSITTRSRLDVETVDRYGGIVARTTLRLSPYTAKKLIERIHLALDAAKAKRATR